MSEKAVVMLQLVSKTNVAVITISDSISAQAQTNDILDMPGGVRNDDGV